MTIMAMMMMMMMMMVTMIMMMVMMITVGDDLVSVSGHRETTALKLIVIQLGQMLMTCGKLFNQAPSVKAGSMTHATVLPSN